MFKINKVLFFEGADRKGGWELSLFLFIMCLWIIKHPYSGIRHDSNLYTAEALRLIFPQNFVNDFYFLNSFQGKFSIFPRIYQCVISAFGVEQANMLLLVAGELLWIWSAFFFSASFAGRDVYFIPLALITTLPSYYGAHQIFSFAEPFLTPRIFAEAFAILSLGFSLQKRFISTLVCLFASSMLHPLMALPGVLVILFFFGRDRKSMSVIFFAIIVFVILAALGVEPFDNLTYRMDGEWLSAVKKRCKDLFLLLWKTDDYLRIAQVACLAIASFCFLKGETKRLLLSSAVVTTGAMILFFLMGDILYNALIIQLQPWRSLWIFTFLSYAASAMIICKINKNNLANCLGVFFLFSPYYGLMGNGLATTLCIFGCLIIIAFNVYPERLAKEFISIRSKEKIISYCLVLLVAAKLIDTYFKCMAQDVNTDGPRIFTMMSNLLPIFVIALIFMTKSKKNGKYSGFFAAFFMSAFVFLALTVWDQRSDMYKFNMNLSPKMAGWKNIIPETSVVFWPGNFSGSWFLLNRANFISNFQASSIVFSKQQAIKFLHENWLIGLDLVSEMVGWMRNVKFAEGNLLFSAEKIVFMCKQYPDLDFVIIPGFFAELWPVSSLTIEGSYFNKFMLYTRQEPVVKSEIYLYNCDVVRRNR